jgi:hypothetical protein
MREASAGLVSPDLTPYCRVWRDRDINNSEIHQVFGPDIADAAQYFSARIAGRWLHFRRDFQLLADSGRVDAAFGLDDSLN